MVWVIPGISEFTIFKRKKEDSRLLYQKKRLKMIKKSIKLLKSVQQNAILINEWSTRNDDWVYGKIDIPEPEEGYVQVNIKSVGLNPVDWKLKHGYLPDYPHEFPIVLGWDMSSTVSSVGYGVSQFKEGDEVFGLVSRPMLSQNHGTYCEYITVPASMIAKKPEKLDFVEASCVPLTSLTAFQALETSGAKEGDSVLIFGASGGVGSWVVQMCAAMGLESIAVASTKNHEYLDQLGANHKIDYSANVEEEVKKIFPEGVDVLLDLHGFETLDNYESLVKDTGALVSIVEFEYTPKNENLPFNFVFVQPNAVQLTQIAEWIDQDKMTLNIDSVFDFKDIEKATERMMKGSGIRGKIAMKINP